MKRKNVVIMAFNSPIDSGCDYVRSTASLLSRTCRVYGLAMGDVTSAFGFVTGRSRWIIRTLSGVTYIRPIMLFGVRWKYARTLHYAALMYGIRAYAAFRYGNARKLFWFFEPFHLPLLLKFSTPYESVYDCVDDFASFSPDAEDEHRYVALHAHHMFVNSGSLKKRNRHLRPDASVVPLGCSTDLFVRSSNTAPPGGPTVLCMGAISSRIDMPLLAHTIALMPDVQFLIVGGLEPDVFGRQDDAASKSEALFALPNVRWLGQRKKTELPSIMSGCHAAVIPYDASNPFNVNSFPMKTMEYFAFGMPVVSTPIQTLMRYERHRVLRIARTPEEMSRALRKDFRNGWTREKIKTRREIAEAHSWTKKVGMMKKLLKLA